MRLDAATPRTWLLAAIAGWALLAWLLALVGMGGRVGMLAADKSLLQPLPQPRAAPAERLGPLAEYAEIGARPLFSDDRRPQPFSLQAEGDDETPANTFDYVLTSVLITPSLREAIVQPSAGGDSVRIKLDEAANEIPDWRLVEINPRSAVFEGPGGQKSLDLRVWDGSGGAPPTEVHATAETDENGEELPAPPAPRPTPRRQPAAKPQQQGGVPAEAQNPGNSNAPGPGDTGGADDANAKAQMDAIRRRIEERRAQLRQQAQKQTPPANNP